MQKNIALNPLPAPTDTSSTVKIDAAVLDWSLSLPDPVLELLQPDSPAAPKGSGSGSGTGWGKDKGRSLTVLAADCVYYEPAFPDLLDTLERLLGGEGEDEDGEGERRCWFCVKRRRKADKRFVGGLGRRFWIREWSLDGEGEGEGRGEIGEGMKGVRLWEVRMKGWVEKGGE